MPLIPYARKCSCKPNLVKKLFKTGTNIPRVVKCDLCGEEAQRLLSGPSSETKITIDNGSMARRVEVNPEIARMTKENSERDHSTED